MAKISRYGGPTDANAAPGDVIEDGLGRLSALHPEEQEALPLHGEGDDNAWIKRDDDAADGVARNDDGEPLRGKQGERVEKNDDDEDGDDVSRGNSSSQSEEKHDNFDARKNDAAPKPASTTGNPSNPDVKPEHSTADSAVKSMTSRGRK